MGPSIKDVTTLEGGGGISLRTSEDMRGRGVYFLEGFVHVFKAVLNQQALGSK